jgi:pyruvate/2-oxoglutarate dehydrogenase complex dihydrolipoamide dehydrogenase (E3) component
MIETFDAIVIGAGQAGPALATKLAGTGLSVEVVEGKLVGGTCVNVGCTPTKAMVASAHAALVARRAVDFGVVASNPVKGETIGFMKELVDAETRMILGASIFGVGGDEAIHNMLTCIYAKKPFDLISEAVYIHPTVAELVPTMLQETIPLE